MPGLPTGLSFNSKPLPGREETNQVLRGLRRFEFLKHMRRDEHPDREARQPFNLAEGGEVVRRAFQA